MTLGVSSNPSAFGATVALSVAVTPSSATGSVTFYADGAPLGASGLTSGAASFSTRMLPAGTVSLTAYYGGDPGNSPAKSNVVRQTVQAGVSNYLLDRGTTTFITERLAVAHGDFNGDGKTDLVVIGANLPIHLTDMTVLLGKGDGTFQTGASTPGFFDPKDVAVGDLNGDGKQDVVVVSNGAAVMLGNGDGTFSNGGYYPAGTDSRAVAIADLNGDGKADLMVANSTSGDVSILLGNGDGTFQAATSIPTAPFAISVGVGDFNGDGLADIATGSTYGTVAIRLQKVDGTFKPAITLINSNFSGRIAVADMNRDGLSDLVIGGQVSIVLGRSDGNLQVSSSLPEQLGGSTVAIGDFNGDGFLDVVAQARDNLLCIFGNGDGTMGSPVVYSSALNIFEFAIADFNGDSRADVAAVGMPGLKIFTGELFSYVATRGTPQSTVLQTVFPNPLEITVQDALGRAVSGLPVTFTSPGAGATASLSATNVTTDATGVARVVATAMTATGPYTVSATSSGLTASFYLSNTLGSPAHLTTVGRTPQATLAGSSFPAPLQALVTDTGGNPLPNVIVSFTAPATGASAALSGPTALTDSTGIAAVTATANSLFGAYSVTANAGALQAVFPLNNQRAASLALTTPQSPATYGHPVTLSATLTPSAASGRVIFYDGVTAVGSAPVNSGTATFTTSVIPAGRRRLRALYLGDSIYAAIRSVIVDLHVIAVPTVAFAYQLTQLNAGPLAVADLNTDGRPDLLSAYLGTLQVQPGDVTANLTRLVSGSTYTRSLRSGDFNLDGKPDLLISSSFNGIQVELGNGNGTFQAPLTAPAGYDAMIADVNGDGVPDLFARTPTSVAVLIGKGDGSFQAGDVYPFVYPIDDLVVADFDGDGNADFAASTSSAIRVFLGSGSGSFHEKTPALSTTYSGVKLLAEDLNGDGKQDLIALDGSALTTRLGNGDGTFQPPASSITGGANEIALADVNGDGVPDIVFSTFANTISSAIGNGDGTFRSGPSYWHDPYSTLGHLVVADFDGDGSVDIAVGFNTAVHLLRGQVFDKTLPVTVGVVAPSGGTGATQTFTATYSAAKGFNDLQWVQLLIAASPAGGGESYCFLHYDVRGNGLWLYGDGGFFVGPITPGTASNRLQNSLCAINTAATTVVGTGTTLTLNAYVAFKQATTKNVYLRAMNLAQDDTGWVLRGTWSAAPANLGALWVTPSTGSGSTQTFTATYPDPPGFEGVAFGWVQLLIAAASDGGGQPFCFVHYDRAGNGLWMYSSDVGFFLGPVAPGTASNALSSSACSVNTGAATVSNTSGALFFSIPITMKVPMAGQKLIFQRTLDTLNRDTGWQQTGTWTVQ